MLHIDRFWFSVLAASRYRHLSLSFTSANLENRLEFFVEKENIYSQYKNCLKTFSVHIQADKSMFFCGVKYCKRRLCYMHCVQLIYQLNMMRTLDISVI